MIIPDPGSRVKKRRGQQRFMDIILAYQYTGGTSGEFFIDIILAKQYAGGAAEEFFIDMIPA
jgi:hypothetical protein